MFNTVTVTQATAGKAGETTVTISANALDGLNKTDFTIGGEPLLGYKIPTASLQYNRHTFPYNTPFWATHKIRNNNPFYDSYSDFSVDFS